MWCYDKKENDWKITGVVPDEEISRFYIIGDTLIAPGIDPAEDWMYGNYYKFDGDKWIKMRRIYDGIHNFDMVEYDGRIFCGLGVKPGKFPIACSYDNGEFFAPVEMYDEDGDLLDTSDYQTVRVYDLFAFNNNLYASFMSYDEFDVMYDIYRYENETFVYDKPWSQEIQYVNYINNIIGGKAEFNGNMFFTTGYLYATADMENFTLVNFPNNQIVYDISVYNDALYALCGEQKEDGKYVVSVWKNDSKKITNFHELFNFTYDIPPLSIACHDEGFYVGMGDCKSTHEKNGMILSVDYKTSK